MPPFSLLNNGPAYPGQAEWGPFSPVATSNCPLHTWRCPTEAIETAGDSWVSKHSASVRGYDLMQLTVHSGVRADA